MLQGLLKSLFTLDYILMVVKSNENRLSMSSKFIYSQIQNLYAKDLSERVLGMFSFSDGAEPQGYIAVKAAGINMTEMFKFNNSTMWTSKREDHTCQIFFEMGHSNFANFTNYII